MKYVVMTTALVLVGCGNMPVSPADIAAVENGLTAADRAAVLCMKTVPACGTPQAKAQIKADAVAAGNAFKALQGASASGQSAAMATAQAALAVLVADTAPVPATK